MARIEKRSDLVTVNVQQCGTCPRRAATTQRPATAEQKQAAELAEVMRLLLDAKRRGLVATEAADTWRVLPAPEV